MANKRISVTSETDSGRNVLFHDNRTGVNMTRESFVRAIEDGQYPNYHIRIIKGIKTPVSNPDRSTSNNLD